jgi:MerR family transcriptional regulator, aldehyde-responsive regulator
MDEMKKTLERLDYKIAVYEQKVIEKENALRKAGD